MDALHDLALCLNDFWGIQPWNEDISQMLVSLNLPIRSHWMDLQHEVALFMDAALDLRRAIERPGPVGDEVDHQARAAERLFAYLRGDFDPQSDS
jgi:hypothetical protein